MRHARERQSFPTLFPDTVTCVAPCGAVVSDNGRFPYTGTTGGLTKTIAGANGYTWSAACCSAGTSSSMRRPRSSSRPPSRPRSEPVRLPSRRAGAGVDPLPTASRCSDGGSCPERKDEPPLVGWWLRGWPPSSVRIPGPRTADTVLRTCTADTITIRTAPQARSPATSASFQLAILFFGSAGSGGGRRSLACFGVMVRRGGLSPSRWNRPSCLAEYPQRFPPALSRSLPWPVPGSGHAGPRPA